MQGQPRVNRPIVNVRTVTKPATNGKNGHVKSLSGKPVSSPGSSAQPKAAQPRVKRAKGAPTAPTYVPTPESSHFSDSDAGTPQEHEPTKWDAALPLADANTRNLVHSRELVESSMNAYEKYFGDLRDPEASCSAWGGRLLSENPALRRTLSIIYAHGEAIPVVKAEYPGKDESFALLRPLAGSSEAHTPIDEILDLVDCVINTFIPPKYAKMLFGHTEKRTGGFADFLTMQPLRAKRMRLTDDILSGDFSMKGSETPVKEDSLFKRLELAKDKKDGIRFVWTLHEYNVKMRLLKKHNILYDYIKTNITAGPPFSVWGLVFQQSYERVVGPSMDQLSKYEAFSNNVYGELLPKFMAQIIKETRLSAGDVFIDLGSGVGNCVIQAALATGCEAYGFENMHNAASLAERQVEEAKARASLWGLRTGIMKTYEADFCDSMSTLQPLLKRASVVLVNNEVFKSELNEQISWLFLDLPTGCRIVSLKPFARGFVLKESNKHSPLAIIDQGPERFFGRNFVSWKIDGGSYYIARVDRSRCLT